MRKTGLTVASAALELPTAAGTHDDGSTDTRRSYTRTVAVTDSTYGSHSSQMRFDQITQSSGSGLVTLTFQNDTDIPVYPFWLARFRIGTVDRTFADVSPVTIPPGAAVAIAEFPFFPRIDLADMRTAVSFWYRFGLPAKAPGRRTPW